MLVGEAFAGGAVVGAEPGVGLDGGGVDVEGLDVGGDGALVVAGVGEDAVEGRGKPVLAELALVFEEDVDGGAARRGDGGGEGGEPGVVEGGDVLAGVGDVPHDFGEIAREGALPAEGVDAVGEGGGEQFVETVYLFEAGAIAFKQIFRQR